MESTLNRIWSAGQQLCKADQLRKTLLEDGGNSAENTLRSYYVHEVIMLFFSVNFSFDSIDILLSCTRTLQYSSDIGTL